MARVTTEPGVRRTIYGDSKAEALRLMRSTLTKAERGEAVADARVSVEKFLIEWLEGTAKTRLRASSYVSYEHYVRSHLVPGLGRYRLARLTPEHIDAYLAGKAKDGLSPRTCQYMRAILRSALGWAVKRGRISRNAAALSTAPRVARRAIVPLTPEEARKVVTAATENRLGPLFVTALDTGARQGELLGLRWSDIDMEAHELRIVQSKQRVKGVPSFGEPKSASSRRMVTFTPTTARMLRDHRKRQLCERLGAGPKWTDSGLVFTTVLGTALDASTVTHQFQKFLAANDLPKQRFHDLRHASASFLLSQGVPIKAISERLGHSQISLTLSTYAHVSAELQRSVAVQMEGVLTGVVAGG